MSGSSIKIDTQFLFAPEPRLQSNLDNQSLVCRPVDVDTIFTARPSRFRGGIRGFIDRVNQGVTYLAVRELRNMRDLAIGDKDSVLTSDEQLKEINRDFTHLCKKVEVAFGKALQYLEYSAKANQLFRSDNKRNRPIVDEGNRLVLAEVLDAAKRSIFAIDHSDNDHGCQGKVKEFLSVAEDLFVKGGNAPREKYFSSVEKIHKCYRGLSKLIEEQIDFIVPSNLLLVSGMKEYALMDAIDDKVLLASRYQAAKQRIYPDEPVKLGHDLDKKELFLLKLLGKNIENLQDPLASLIFESGKYYSFRSDRLVLSIFRDPKEEANIRSRFAKVTGSYKDEVERAGKFIDENIPELRVHHEKYYQYENKKIEERLKLAISLSKLLKASTSKITHNKI